MTQRQLELREEYNNKRIGMCRLPHCRTTMPMKIMFGEFCYYHSAHITKWLLKNGIVERDPRKAAEMYGRAIKSRASRIFG